MSASSLKSVPGGKPKKGSPHWNVIIAAKVGIETINEFDTFSTDGVKLGDDCVLLLVDCR